MKRPVWLKSAEMIAAASYEHDRISRTRTVSLQSMTGAVMNTEEGEYDLLILPYVYEATQDVDGKPLNVFLKMNARLQIPSRRVANTLLVGADWNMDKNYGEGQVFDAERPVYPTAQIRMRGLSEKPANHTLSFYAEEKATMPIGACQLELMAAESGIWTLAPTSALRFPVLPCLHNLLSYVSQEVSDSTPRCPPSTSCSQILPISTCYN